MSNLLYDNPNYDITSYDYLHIIRMLSPAGEITSIRYILSNHKSAETSWRSAGFNFRSPRAHRRKTGEKYDWKADTERALAGNCLVHTVHMPATYRHWGTTHKAEYKAEQQMARELRNEALLSYRLGHTGTTMIHSLLHCVGAQGDYTYTMEVMA
jgi:hypothetical protein